MSDYSIWWLEYARVQEFPVGSFIYRMPNAGTRQCPMSYAVIQGHGHTALVDVGIGETDCQREISRIAGVELYQAPKTVLPEIGLRPEDIDAVFVTHAHYDHFGNPDAFPNAVFYVQEREVSKWLWSLALPHHLQFFNDSIDPGVFARLAALATEGRLRLVDGDLPDVFPGVSLRAAFDTHTWGSMWVEVRTGPGSEETYAMAGDNVYVYENLEGVDGDGLMRPIGIATGNNTESLLLIDEMVRSCGGVTRHVVPVHEMRIVSQYPSRRTALGLNVVEVCRAGGAVSRVR